MIQQSKPLIFILTILFSTATICLVLFFLDTSNYDNSINSGYIPSSILHRQLRRARTTRSAISLSQFVDPKSTSEVIHSNTPIEYHPTIEQHEYLEQYKYAYPSIKHHNNVLPNEGDVIVDVVSIGSESRFDYMTSQLQTWASTSRNFYGFTESTDFDPSCTLGLSDESVRLDYVNTCRLPHVGTKEYGIGHGNSGGWICAQRRVGKALGWLEAVYSIHRKGGVKVKRSIPDILVIVDDDTSVDLNKIKQFMIKEENSSSSEEPNIAAGSVFQLGKYGGFKAAHGGFGTYLNKAAIDLMTRRPIFCNKDDGLISTTPEEEDPFTINACTQLAQNKAQELDVYTPGDSVFNIFYKLASRPYFCMHSDWMIGYMVTNYGMTRDGLVQVDPQGKRGYCGEESVSCHYQTPALMEQFVQVHSQQPLPPPLLSLSSSVLSGSTEVEQPDPASVVQLTDTESYPDGQLDTFNVPSIISFSPREGTSSFGIPDYGRVLLYITSHMSSQHEMFLKYCWPNVLARSSLLYQVDVAVYLNPADQERRKEAVSILQDTFVNHHLTIYLRENEVYNTGAVMAMYEAVSSNFFDGYDWIIRLNPDVMIRDDTFLRETMVDPTVSALLINCSNRGTKAHTDFFVIRPNVFDAKLFTKQIIQTNAEQGFTSLIQDSVLSKGTHRWIPNTNPKTSSCRAGNHRDYYESPIVHEHVMHPDICSIPESDIEIVNSVFTDPWPSKWTVADHTTNQAVQNELAEEVGSQFQSFLPPSEMEPTTPLLNAQSFNTDAEAACDNVILYFTDDFGGHGIGSQLNTYLQVAWMATYLDMALVLVGKGQYMGCPDEMLEPVNLARGHIKLMGNDSFPNSLSRLLDQPTWLSRQCPVPCSDTNLGKKLPSKKENHSVEPAPIITCQNDNNRQSSVMVVNGVTAIRHFHYHVKDRMVDRSQQGSIDAAYRWALRLGAGNEEAQLFSSMTEEEDIWDYISALTARSELIRFQPWISRDIENYVKENNMPLATIDGNYYSSIHVRRGDKVNRESKAFVNAYWKDHAVDSASIKNYIPFKHYLTQFHDMCGEHSVYIATDDPEEVGKEIEELPKDDNGLVYLEGHECVKFQFSFGAILEEGYHNQWLHRYPDKCKDLYTRIIASITDLTILIRSGLFVGEYNANFGRLVRTYRMKVNDIQMVQQGEAPTIEKDTKIAWGNPQAKYAHSTEWKVPNPDPPDNDVTLPVTSQVTNEANTLLDFYTKIYTSPYPAVAAGAWVEKPSIHRPIISPEHLHCLDREFQGNCHSVESNLKRNSTAEYRHTIFNSPGILAADDQFTWQSNHPLYDVMPNDNIEEYRTRLNNVLKSRTIFLIGDSLTRQWYQTMKCELMHVLGLSDEEVNEKVRWKRCTNELRRQRKDIQQMLTDATLNDVLVFNFGHHVGLKNGENWKTKYEKILNDALSFDFGAIPDENIFFRTTSVRHFLRGYGDWDTDFTAGNTAPDMYAQWETYGGNMPEQPDQNLIAFSTLLKSSNHRSFQILDTSPLMLARGDATFDGSHFCLPGPVDMWSRMLYARLEARQLQSYPTAPLSDQLPVSSALELSPVSPSSSVTSDYGTTPPRMDQDICSTAQGSLHNIAMDMIKRSSPPCSSSYLKLRHIVSGNRQFYANLSRGQKVRNSAAFTSNELQMIQLLQGAGLVQSIDSEIGVSKDPNILLVEGYHTFELSPCPLFEDRCKDHYRIVIQSEQAQSAKFNKYMPFWETCHTSPNCIIFEFSDYNYNLYAEDVRGSVVLLPVMTQTPSRLAHFEPTISKELKDRELDVVFFGSISRRRKVFTKNLNEYLTSNPNRQGVFQTSWKTKSITNSYKEGKVCILPHTHGAISGGEYHRYSEFGPFGCVPVIEHFADTIGIEVYEQCGGVVFASYEDIWETAIDVVQKIDRGLYTGSSQRYANWWKEGIHWEKILPAIYGDSDNLTCQTTSPDAEVGEASDVIIQNDAVRMQHDHDDRLLSTVQCSIDDSLPKGWCLDYENQVPRYLGQDTLDKASVGQQTFEYKLYTYDGYQHCLANKTLVFIGESRTRYQFMHLGMYLNDKHFMRCEDHQIYTSNTILPEHECLSINEQMEGQHTDWNSWFKEATNLLTSNNDQEFLCDCFRPTNGGSNHFVENSYIKRNTPYGNINLVFLSNLRDNIRMNQDFPPFSPFSDNTISSKRCTPGECGRAKSHDGDSVDAWSGNLNEALETMVPMLNATHVFVNSGWEFGRDISCDLNEFAKSHPNIEVSYMSHPLDTSGKVKMLDPTIMECQIGYLDRTTISSNVPLNWYWNELHVLSILNEEFNHQLIKKICPIE